MAAIERVRSSGGAVLVHCAQAPMLQSMCRNIKALQGKSRSAALVVAYLVWKQHVTPQQALDHIRQARHAKCMHFPHGLMRCAGRWSSPIQASWRSCSTCTAPGSLLPCESD